MCDRNKHATKHIDQCLLKEIELINQQDDFKTRLSCCGHGRYTKTIIVENIKTGTVFEYYTGKELESKYKNGRKRKRFYKKDRRGYYYLPGISQEIKKEHKMNLSGFTLDFFNKVKEIIKNNFKPGYIIEVKHLRKIMDIEGKDRSKIIFLSRVLKELESKGFLVKYREKEVSRVKQYKVA